MVEIIQWIFTIEVFDQCILALRIHQRFLPFFNKIEKVKYFGIVYSNS